MVQSGLNIYFDNAASTPLREEVKSEMISLMDLHANPSSTHGFGRKAKTVLEASRKSIAKQLGCLPAEIVFCSGGTEADNAAISLALRDLKLKRLISAPTEHHAVLHAAERWTEAFGAELVLLNVDAKGRPDLEQLQDLLQSGPPSLVSLMHGNNEVGNLLDLQKIGQLCHANDSYFHSDTVQTVGHFPINFEALPVDFAGASAHKFYGPKGAGFMYISKRAQVSSFITGGSQERGLRGGTENIVSVGAMALALDLAYELLEAETAHIIALKKAMWSGLQELFPKAYTNGLSGDFDSSLYTVLNVSIPELASDPMLLFNLDLKGIAVSGGSACSSGAAQGSHVIAALNPNHTDPVIRFSFSKNNSLEEVQQCLGVLKQMKA